MKKWLLLGSVVCLAAILVLAGCAQQAPAPAPSPAPKPSPAASPAPSPAPAPAAKIFQLKLATHTPPTHYMVKGAFEPLAAELEKRTGGRVKVTIYPSNQLGQINETYDMVRKGIADMALVVQGAHPGLFPLTDFFNLPFLLGYDEASKRAGVEIIKKYIEQTEYKDVKLIYNHRWSAIDMHLAKKPIRKIEDFKGMVFGISGGQITTNMIKTLGGAPELVGSSDAYSALEKGMIEGYFNPMEVAVAYKLYEIIKYITMLDLGTGTAAVCLNKQTWNSMPADIQQIIDELSPWARETAVKAQDNYREQAIPTLKEKGVELIYPTKEEMARFAQATASLEADWAKAVDAKGLPGTQMITEARQLRIQYSK